jgi:EAL domain-containing protein (putative c-di-GMP-specific phosphodiesterase class I)
LYFLKIVIVLDDFGNQYSNLGKIGMKIQKKCNGLRIKKI